MQIARIPITKVEENRNHRAPLVAFPGAQFCQLAKDNAHAREELGSADRAFVYSAATKFREGSMSDAMKSMIVGALIVAAALLLAPERAAPPRYAISSSSSGAFAWKIDSQSGKTWLCAFNGRCREVK